MGSTLAESFLADLEDLSDDERKEEADEEENEDAEGAMQEDAEVSLRWCNYNLHTVPEPSRTIKTFQAVWNVQACKWKC